MSSKAPEFEKESKRIREELERELAGCQEKISYLEKKFLDEKGQSILKNAYETNPKIFFVDERMRHRPQRGAQLSAKQEESNRVALQARELVRRTNHSVVREYGFFKIKASRFENLLNKKINPTEWLFYGLDNRSLEPIKIAFYHFGANLNVKRPANCNFGDALDPPRDDVPKPNQYVGYTPLQQAIYDSSSGDSGSDIIIFLVEHGADFKAKAPGNKDLLELLIESCNSGYPRENVFSRIDKLLQTDTMVYEFADQLLNSKTNSPNFDAICEHIGKIVMAWASKKATEGTDIAREAARAVINTNIPKSGELIFGSGDQKATHDRGDRKILEPHAGAGHTSSTESGASAANSSTTIGTSSNQELGTDSNKEPGTDKHPSSPKGKKN